MFAYGLLACAVLFTATAADPASPRVCGKREVRVWDRDSKSYRCQPGLERTGDIFQDEKHEKDPCREGFWWARRRNNPCVPVECREQQNQADLTKGLCARGHHPHLDTGGDWERPIVCVLDYSPQNEATGGKSVKKDGCERCTIRAHLWQPSDWNLEKPGGKKKDKKKRRRKKLRGRGRGGSWITGGPPDRDLTVIGASRRRRYKKCGLGRYSTSELAAKCETCPKDAVTVRTPEGRNVCVGGRDVEPCPAGLWMGPDDEACRSCDTPRHLWQINIHAVCLHKTCPKGQVPAPHPNGTYQCMTPLEKPDDITWSKVLPETLQMKKSSGKSTVRRSSGSLRGTNTGEGAPQTVPLLR
jgi:hypothetical protein